MLACTDPGYLQTAFNAMMGLFDRVGLNKNVQETVGMVCHPFRAAGVRADKSYTQQMKVSWRSYKEIQREQVNFPECGKELARGSLSDH